MIKILVAEDDKFLMSAYKAKLTKEGFEVVVAPDGSEVVNILKNFTPDIILMDLVMPKLDGFGVLEELGKNSSWSKIPVIVASNLGQSEDLERAKSLGAVDYIVKSDLSMDELVKKIKETLKI